MEGSGIAPWIQFRKERILPLANPGNYGIWKNLITMETGNIGNRTLQNLLQVAFEYTTKRRCAIVKLPVGEPYADHDYTFNQF